MKQSKDEGDELKNNNVLTEKQKNRLAIVSQRLQENRERSRFRKEAHFGESSFVDRRPVGGQESVGKK